MNGDSPAPRAGLGAGRPVAHSQSSQGAVAAQSATISLDSANSRVPAMPTSAVSGHQRRRRNARKRPAADTTTSANVTEKKGAKGAWMHHPPAHFNRSNQTPLANIVDVMNPSFHQDLHSATKVNNPSRGTKKPNGAALNPIVNSTITTASKAQRNRSSKHGIGYGYSTTPHVSRSSQPSSSQTPSPRNPAQHVNDDNKPLPKAAKVKSGQSTAQANPQGSTSSPPPINVNSRHTSTDRPPTICERYEISDPLNDYRFRTNDYAPEFTVAEEEDFRRRLAECHIFNMTQPDTSVKRPRANVKKQKQQKQKQQKQKQNQKADGGGTAAGTPSKGKGKGKN